MEVVELLRYVENSIWYVTFKYWKTGECACGATKQKSMFEADPTKEDLINAIGHGI